MYGIGILKGMSVTLRHFVDTIVDDIQWFGRRNGLEAFQTKQGLKGKGMYTVQYPEEKIAVPERFRFVPFLVKYDDDDPEYAGKDWCTSCGICAKVCPPQCIWIVRGTNPETGRPKPEPEQFFIDIDICMNCGYCAEYCPFDAIKMDHDYELASFDRTSHHIYDKEKLSKPVTYWQTIAPTTAAEEMVARGGYDHTDIQKTRKKAGLPASRPGKILEKPAAAPTPSAAVPAGAVAGGVAAEATPSRPAPEQAPAVSADLSAAKPTVAAGATHTADGKPIVRRRGAAGAAATPGAAAPRPEAVAAGGNPVGPQVQPEKVDPQAGSQQSVAAPTGATAPTASSATAPDSTGAPQTPEGGNTRTGPKPRDPNTQQVVRRRNNPPPKKD